jgi:hypothetical protein
VPLLSDKTGVGPYYEIIPLKESDVPLNRPVNSVCSGCRREDVDGDEDVDVVYPVDVNRPGMVDEIWRGDSVFYLATTLYIIVTNEIKEALTRLNRAMSTSSIPIEFLRRTISGLLLGSRQSRRRSTWTHSRQPAELAAATEQSLRNDTVSQV